MPTPDAHQAAAALVDVRHVPYWLDGPAPDPCPALAGPTTADLAVVGGGYTGLWTALLAFSLSFDDFIITNFNSGAENTFPKFVWVSSLRGIPAQANVIASFMFFLALVAVVIGQVVTGRRKSS